MNPGRVLYFGADSVLQLRQTGADKMKAVQQVQMITIYLAPDGITAMVQSWSFPVS